MSDLIHKLMKCENSLIAFESEKDNLKEKIESIKK